MSRHAHSSGAAWLFALALSIPYPAAAYQLLDLGTLGGAESFAWAINSLGQVVGYATTAGGAPHAFRTGPNSPIDESTDDLGVFVGGRTSYGYGLNDLGQAAGVATLSDGSGRAFRTDATGPIDPSTDNLGAIDSRAVAVDGAGRVAGSYFNTTAWAFRPFRTMPNAPIALPDDDLGPFTGTQTFATGMNNAGQIIGWSYSSHDGSGPSRSFRTQPNATIDVATDDLGSLGGDATQARAINDLGQVVGYSLTADGFVHAFRTAPNGAIDPALDDLGTLGGDHSVAYGINGAGDVVGTATLPGGASRPFVWTERGGMQDLSTMISPASGSALYIATAINDAKQIVGYAYTPSGPFHAFLLSPVCGDGVVDPGEECDDGPLNGAQGGTCCAANCASNDGAPCDDGNSCTRSDSCQSGTCAGSDPVVCSDGGSCREDGVCNVGTGECSYVSKPDQTPCKGNGVCESGLCRIPETDITRVGVTASSAAANSGRIRLGGSLLSNPPADTFGPQAGIRLRMQNDADLDVSVTFTAEECSSTASGRFVCRSQDGTSRAQFGPSRITPGAWVFRVSLRSLAIAGPFQAGMTVRIFDDGDVVRVGRVVAAACRTSTSKMSCRQR